MNPFRNRLTFAGIIALMLSTAALISSGRPASAADGRAGSIWGAGYFPDTPLISQQGKSVRFFTDLIKGKVVLINFIYTSCPDECALETARLREVQRILGDRVGKDVFLYSISIDPEHDTPQVLKEYAAKFQAAPGWLFLTGKEADVTALRKKLGVYSDPDQGGKFEDHNLSFVIGNQATGQWMKISSFENPYVLANQLGSWLHNWKMPPKEQRDYADAPKVRNISAGEGLFRTRCAACHTIGAEDVSGSDKRPIGPDLLGVTHKRERPWLVRWLATTDKMLADKDPLAVELLGKFNNLPMPNLRLAGADIEALLTYIDEESHRIEHQRQHHHHGDHHHDDHHHDDHHHDDHHHDDHHHDE